MGNLALGAVVAILAVVALVLARQVQVQSHGRAKARAQYFDACKPLFAGLVQARSETGFARISGQRGGRTFDLQAVPDTLTYRKLPALWLLVTLPTPLPVGATFDLMIRPMGVEPFSNFGRLPDQILAPPGFPADCAIRTDNPDALPPEDLLRRHLGVFDDLRMKELVIGPKGLRLVWLADEAVRGRYLIFRDAEMGQTPLLPDQVLPLMAALEALHLDILATIGKAAT